MDLTLNVWRQPGPDAPGKMERYEAPGVDPDHLVDVFSVGGLGQEPDRGLEEFSVPQDRGDILEDDAGLREVLDIADGVAEVVGVGHGRDLAASGRFAQELSSLPRRSAVGREEERRVATPPRKFHLHESSAGTMQRAWRNGC